MFLRTRDLKIVSMIKQSVNKQDLVQKTMAQDLHLSPQLFSHMLTGKRSMGLERTVEISEYLQDSDLDYDIAFELFQIPKPLKRNRRDNHPSTKMIGQDREEMERIEIEKRYDIWDLIGIPLEDITSEELSMIKVYLFEMKDEISAEIEVFNSICNRYGLNSRSIVKEAEQRERDD